ncbi:hypothetical protein BV25DRAFT_1987241, partial [Artomyces pyxidatus]
MAPTHKNGINSDSQSSGAGDGAVDKVADALQKASLQSGSHPDEGDALKDGSPASPRPFRSYTQAEVLFLRKSPLVRPPQGMPALKDWFGDWNEQNGGKKDAEPSTTTSTTRDRRFRRDQEDGEPPPRATFRSTLSQPSQMGNFKHQSIRTSDRDREKDGDKDKERDIRDREGQERLRSLSDKYDRDRLATPPNSNGVRNRERDSAPHLSAGTSRLGSQNSTGTGNRKAEGRDGTRRKPGESSEDWRRGRDERAEGLRRDRDDRERPRSRVRDTSRQRQDASPPLRRDRDRDDRGPDRDEYRRNRDEHSRRDADRESNDDARRWRDDGKREERMAARRELREREYRERERERDKERPARNGGSSYEPGWEGDRPRDRDRDRWSAADERDTRSKRANGRDKRAGSGDEGKDRDERRDRDRDHREKEKEPAWMDTYVPSDSGGGILGGKSADGELDGIQAWKKGMKEREMKEKASEASRSGDTEPQDTAKQVSSTEQPMDEIQLFKLMIKREGEKSKLTTDSTPSPPAASISSGAVGLQDQVNPPIASSAPSLPVDSDSSITQGPLSSSSAAINTLSQPAPTTIFPAEGPRPGFSALAAEASLKSSSSQVDSPKAVGSRFFPNPSPSDSFPNHGQILDRSPANAIKSPMPAQFNPPPGSRLLAFASRTSSATSNPARPSGLADQSSGYTAHPHHPTEHPVAYSSDMARLGSDADMLAGQLRGNGPRAQSGFTPFSNQMRPSMYADDVDTFAQSEAARRQSLAAQGDRQFGGPPDSMSPYSELSGNGNNPLGLQSNYPPPSQSPSFDPSMNERANGGSPYPPTKGSRFAKFFDGKARDNQVHGMNLSPHVQPSPPPHSFQRQDLGGEPYGAGAENRTMEDIFAMLQNSSQGQRGVPVNSQAPLASLGNGPYVSHHPNLHSGHQQQQHHAVSARNHELLYDNRVEDRNFVPDGMVPGLRSIPAPRRENAAMFHDQLDDQMAFNVQPRLPPQRSMDTMYNGPIPSMYPHQAAVPRNSGLPLQQPYRNGSSPIANQNHLPQRLPPGLANLGGRPPHEPSQFLGSLMGGAAGGPQQPGGFNNYVGGGGGGLGYAGGPQQRGPPLPPHQLQNPLGPGLGKMDMRAQAQAQLLGGGLRGPGLGFAPQQGQGPAVPVHPPHMAMRHQQLQHQQQQQQLLQQGIPQHLLPPHLQGVPGGSSQPTQDLMALLMQGAPRE